MGERLLPVFARALDMPADYFAPIFTNEAHINLRFLHYPPQESDDDEQFGQGPHTDNSFLTMLAREDVPGPRRAPAERRVARAAGDRRHLPRQPRQRHEAVVERPLPVDAARRGERLGHGTATRSRSSTAPTWTASSSACRAAWAPTTRRATRPRSTAISCSISTTPTTSTGPDTTKPGRPDPARRQPRYSRVVPAITASTSPRPMVIAWPAWPATMTVSIDSLTPES